MKIRALRGPGILASILVKSSMLPNRFLMRSAAKSFVEPPTKLSIPFNNSLGLEVNSCPDVLRPRVVNTTAAESLGPKWFSMNRRRK